jgi:NADH-quinone oxidoreductase subunit J
MLGILSSLPLPSDPPLGDQLVLVDPRVILTLCVAAGIGTFLLLPGRKQAPKLGGVLVIISAVVFALVLAHAIAGPGRGATRLYFWIFSAIAVIGAIRVITHPRPVYSALYFVLTVFASAGLFILLYAEFLAAALVLIYAGAILVTYVFVIMLAASAQSPGNPSPLAGLAECDTISREPFTAACLGFTVMGVLLFLIFDQANRVPQFAPSTVAGAVSPEETVQGSTQSVGKYLFQNQLVNFEVAGLILTVSMVGAIVIARRRVDTPDDAYEPSSETITATATPVNDDPHSIPVYGTTNPSQKAFPEA